jgi:hypothetical protein
MVNYMSTIKRALFRPPRRDGKFWILSGLGVVLTVSATAEFLLSGEVTVMQLLRISGLLVLTFWGMSEIVPENSNNTAAILRICMTLSFIAFLGYFIFCYIV